MCYIITITLITEIVRLLVLVPTCVITELLCKHVNIHPSIGLFIPECSVTDQHTHTDKPSCQLLPLLDRYTYTAKFHNKFAHINDSRLEDVIVPLSENVSKIIPFYIEDGEDNGGSLKVTGDIKDVLSVHVSILCIRLFIVSPCKQ